MSDSYFDIAWIIELLKKQEPDRTDLIEQLEKSARRKWIRQPYILLVSADKPNKPGSEGQIAESLALEHEEEGTIVIDILKDGRIRGIEFVSQIWN